MKERLLDLLRCVRCEGGGPVDAGALRPRFSVEIQEAEGDEVLRGSVRCARCSHRYTITNGILRTVSADAYTGAFSFEWQLHRRTQLDTPQSNKSARTFVQKTGLTPADLAGKRVLDVGVGTGRFADVVARAGAEVVGIDLSYAVETAMENIGRRPGVNIVQADLFNLPFAAESFDIVYSIGVLHHTPDCRKAFLSIVPYLRPGGTIAIWVYDGHNWSSGSVQETVNRFWRSITTRLPHRVLYSLCLLELPLNFLRRLPAADQLMHLALPGAIYHAVPRSNKHPRLKEHILDTFDWYAPKYQSKHTYAEVFSWFEEAGLQDMRVLARPVAMSGRKPVERA